MKYIRHTEFLKLFGENLRRIRLEKNLSQDEIAFNTQLSTNQVGRIERGEINTGISTVFEIATFLEIPIEDLFKNLSKVK